MSKKEFIKGSLTKKECVKTLRLVNLANWLRNNDDAESAENLHDYVKFVSDGTEIWIVKNNLWSEISEKHLKRITKDEPGVTEYKKRIDNFLENES